MSVSTHKSTQMHLSQEKWEEAQRHWTTIEDFLETVVKSVVAASDEKVSRAVAHLSALMNSVVDNDRGSVSLDEMNDIIDEIENEVQETEKQAAILSKIISKSLEDFQSFVKQNDSDLRICDQEEKQLVHHVVEYGNHIFLQVLLETRQHNMQNLQFVHAHQSGSRQMEQMKQDFERKIFDIDVTDSSGKTALVICAQKGFYECFKLLLEAGANYNHVDAKGRSCLHYSIFGESKTKNWRHRQSGDIDIDKHAQHREFTSILNELLKIKDLNLEQADKKRNWTPLFQAVGGGTVDVVTQLVDKGASFERVDRGGETLLHVAVRYNQSDVLQYLLLDENISNSSRFKLNHKNIEQNTPIMLAIYNKYETCLRILSVFESRNNLINGLLLSVKTNSPALVKYLLRVCKIDPNFVDKDKMTCSRWAAFYGYAQVLKELLLSGARDDIDEFGQNIVFYAAKHDQMECLKLLKKANADFSIVNNEGETAMDKAPTGSEAQRFIQNVQNWQKQQEMDEYEVVIKI